MHEIGSEAHRSFVSLAAKFREGVTWIVVFLKTLQIPGQRVHSIDL